MKLQKHTKYYWKKLEKKVKQFSNEEEKRKNGYRNVNFYANVNRLSVIEKN